MKGATILLATLIGSLSMGAVAQQTMGEGSESPVQETRTFTELDTNSDGVLDESEVEEGNFSGEFDDLDRDGDDEVNRNEYYQYYRDQGGQNR